MYEDTASHDPMMVIANNEVGTNWCTPFVVNLEVPNEGGSNIISWWQQNFLSAIGSQPAIGLRYQYVEDDIVYNSAVMMIYH
jgi:hypothetical protein